jgi:thioredoxin-like negative regulator of GroEL
VSKFAATTALTQTERPRLVFFYDERSGRSRQTEGHLAQVLQRRRNHTTFQIHRVESGQRPDLASRFGIHTIPTLLVVQDRRVKTRLENPRGCKEIELALRPWLQ